MFDKDKDEHKIEIYNFVHLCGMVFTKMYVHHHLEELDMAQILCLLRDAPCCSISGVTFL